MWLLIFLFLVVTLIVGWTLFGYLLLVWFMGLLRRKETVRWPDQWPSMSVVVPCHNECGGILDKLADIRKLGYEPGKVEVIFADGGSTDGTVDLLRSVIKADEGIRVIQCPEKGKINQLNHVLPQLKGDIIVNTDADARLDADALKWMAAEFAADEDVWVVGAYCRPAGEFTVEGYYWDAQNKGRFLETDAQTSSIVIAQCYGFRRGLLRAFPEDVVADDIYVALQANALGHRTVYSRKVTAVEMRTPSSYAELLPHKFRKGNAFLRESLRFLYRLPEMSPFCKMMLTTRVAQQLLLPWAALFWVLVASVLLTLFRYDIVLFGVFVLLVLLLLTSRVFAWVKLPDNPRRYSSITVVKGYLVTMLILLATGISYPFYRQGSCYTRLGNDHRK